jgi:hypothetical protein
MTRTQQLHAHKMIIANLPDGGYGWIFSWAVQRNYTGEYQVHSQFDVKQQPFHYADCGLFVQKRNNIIQIDQDTFNREKIHHNLEVYDPYVTTTTTCDAVFLKAQLNNGLFTGIVGRN